MTHQPDHESTADKVAVTPPPALTTEGRLRARVQTLEEDAERNQGLAKVGARCMREGHQGLIESGRATVEGHRFALSVALDLGTDATWDAIHERVKELRRDSAEPAAVSAAVAPPTNRAAPSLRAGLRDEIVKALGRITTVLPVAHRREQADHVLAVLYREWPWLRAEAEDAEPTDRAAAEAALAAVETALCDTLLPDAREEALARLMTVLPPTTDRAAVLREAATLLDQRASGIDALSSSDFGEEARAVRELARAATELRRMADETATETQRRCPSCDHEAKYHAADDGRCWFTVDHGAPGANLVCPCIPRDPGDDEPAAGARQDGAES